MPALRIRPAAASDLEALGAIYAHYVAATPVTFALRPPDAAERRAWFEGFGERGRHRLFVAERGGAVVGYACSHPFRAQGAYAVTVETTIYLEPAATGAGIGRRLYTTLLDALAEEDVHRALAGVALPNPASVALHERLGFEVVGTFHEVGYKLGRYWDVRWFERALR